MNALFEFIAHHPFLWLALAVIIILLILEESKRSIKGVIRISTQEAVDLINHEHAVVIDIRDADNFTAGHLIDAINIPNQTLTANIKQIMKYKPKPLIITDDNGQLAVTAAVTLRQHDVEKLYILDGGIDAWQRAGLPLVTK